MCDRPPTSSHRRWGHDAQGGVRFGGRLGADAESYVPWGVLAAGLFPMILATLDRRLAHFAFLEKEPRGWVFSLRRALPLAWLVRHGKQGHVPADFPIALVVFATWEER